MKSKIVVAISQSNQAPWTEIKKVQEKTWINKYKDEALIIHYSSKKLPIAIKLVDTFFEKYRFSEKLGRLISILNRIISNFISRNIPKYDFTSINNELTVKSFSTYFLFGRRNLALYDWFIKETDAKFLFQTNTSSYIDVRKLQLITSTLEKNSVIFAGVINNPNSQNFKIISGAGRLLSRELVVEILKNKKHLKFNNLEDICISELVSTLSATIIALDRFDLVNMQNLDDSSDVMLRKHFHFRCKSDTLPRADAEIMLALHNRLLES